MGIPTSQSEAAKLGKPKYRTGKPCKYGHISDRYTMTANCCKCVVESVYRRRAEIRRMAFDTRCQTE